MKVQTALSLQSLPTDVANKVLVYGVFYHVLLQSMLIRAPFVTFGTVHNFAFALFRDNSMISLIKEVRRRSTKFR